MTSAPTRFAPCPHCGRTIAPGTRCPYCLDGTRPAPVPTPAGGPASPRAPSPGGQGRPPPHRLPPPLRMRRAHKVTWGALIIVVLVVGALFLVLRLIAGESALFPWAPALRLHAGPSVTQEQGGRVLALAEEAEGILAGYAGGHLPSLDVFVQADRHALAADLAAWTGETESDAWRVVSRGAWVFDQGAIFIDLTPPDRSPQEAFWRIAHEEAHAFLQRLYSPAEAGWRRGDCWLSHRSTMHPSGPMWLIEGSAERLAFRAITDSSHWVDFAGGRTAQEFEKELVAQAYAGSSHRLEFLANATYLAAEDYDLAFAAVAHLEERRTAAAVVEYWRQLGGGYCWDEAFVRAFRISVADFYTDFESRRPPVDPDAAD